MCSTFSKNLKICIFLNNINFFLSNEDECNFENEKCNFFDGTNDDSATFLWTVQNCRSLKDLDRTGPPTDSSGSDEGRFIFVSGDVETREPPLQTELMHSKFLTGTKCLSFEFDLSVIFGSIFTSNCQLSELGPRIQSAKCQKIRVQN